MVEAHATVQDCVETPVEDDGTISTGNGLNGPEIVEPSKPFTPTGFVMVVIVPPPPEVRRLPLLSILKPDCCPLESVGGEAW